MTWKMASGVSMAYVEGLSRFSPNFDQKEFNISLAVAFLPGFLQIIVGSNLMLFRSLYCLMYC